MKHELTFDINSHFDSITFDNEGNNWMFSFDDDINISVSGFWRLLNQNKIMFVSLDNNQEFGNSEPLDIIFEITKLLTGKKLIEINVLKDTCDLILSIIDNIKIEIFISSTGFETYDLSIHGERYIGLGSGAQKGIIKV